MKDTKEEYTSPNSSFRRVAKRSQAKLELNVRYKYGLRKYTDQQLKYHGK